MIMKTEKPIAIRVETKQEFDALMKHYESKRWLRSLSSPTGGRSCPEKSVFNIVTYAERWITIDESNTIATRKFEILSFRALSTLTGIKCEVEPIIINSLDVQYRVNYGYIECMLIGGHKFTMKPDTVTMLSQALASLK